MALYNPPSDLVLPMEKSKDEEENVLDRKPKLKLGLVDVLLILGAIFFTIIANIFVKKGIRK